MPIYEYHCEACGTFEVNQRIKDSPLRRCPDCKGKVRKLISQTSFQLKGSGWYVTDYASKGESSAKEESKSSGSKRDAKAESKESSSSTPKSEATAA